LSSQLKLAISLALSTAIISGVANFVSKMAVTVVKDPTTFTFLKNGIVALLLIGLLIFTRRWPEVKKLSRSDITKLVAIGVIGGSLPFILFFTGLAMVSAINAAFIHKTMFVWVAILAVPFLKERVGKLQFAALTLLLGGNLVISGLPSFSGSRGELMILAATFLWAIENIIAKKALVNISSPLVASARMTLGSIIILAIIAIQGKTSLLVGLSPSQWGWTLLTSFLLTSYVLTWYTALKYAPATLVASLLVPATLVTNALNALFITHTFPALQLLSGTLLSLGIVLIISRANHLIPRANSQPSSTQSIPVK